MQKISLKKVSKMWYFSVKKDDRKIGKQQFRSNSCFGYFQENRGKQINYQNYYSEYLLERRALSV